MPWCFKVGNEEIGRVSVKTGRTRKFLTNASTPLPALAKVEGFAWACGYSENQRERLYQSVANLLPGFVMFR